MKVCALILCLLLLIAGCAVQVDVPDAPDAPEELPIDTNGDGSGVSAPQGGGDGSGASAEQGDGGNAGGNMEVAVFGIGRSDAILIKTENHAVMIDTGERQHGLQIADYILGHGISRIDYLIITHFDSDHVGGAYVIINSVDVGAVIVPNYRRETNHVARFEAAMRDAALVATILTETMRFTLDDVDFTVDPSRLDGAGIAWHDREGAGHSPNDPDGEDDEDQDWGEDGEAGREPAHGGTMPPTGDDMSIVVRVTHGGNNLLFTGDAVAGRLQELLENDVIMGIAYDFLKVPRHGRYSERSAEFINAISPRYAVITGFHPDNITDYYPERPTDQRVIAALESAGAEVFYAMSTGVSLKSDGISLMVQYNDFFAPFA